MIKSFLLKFIHCSKTTHCNTSTFTLYEIIIIIIISLIFEIILLRRSKNSTLLRDKT